jgi:holo-[acyl-carrier protein] synthase
MIGIDIISIARMQRFLDRFGEKGLRRFLHEDEIRMVKSSKTAAGFWATKEAFSKALGTGISSELRFHDIQIVKNKNGAPHVKLSSTFKEKYCIDTVAVSISHDEGFAVAVALIAYR